LFKIKTVAVFVNGSHIKNSPFKVEFVPGGTVQTYSYTKGPGLKVGTAGVPSFFEVLAFDLDNNRKADNNDLFTYSVSGANSLSGNLLSCPVTGEYASMFTCDPLDGDMGHYYGIFTPTKRGNINVNVYLSKTDSSLLNYDPTTIPGLSLWLDSKDPRGNGTLPKNGSPVSKWIDKSGNSRSASSINGKPVPVYDSSTSSLRFSSSYLSVPYLASPTSETIFIVIEFLSILGNQTLFGGINPGQRTYVLYKDKLYLSGFGKTPKGNVNGGSAVLNSRTVFDYTYSPSTASFYTNGVLQASGALGFSFSSGASVDYIGPLDAKIYEILVYNTILTNDERKSIEMYLSNKWNIKTNVMYSPSLAYIHPTFPVAENTVVGGTLYDNTAGIDAYVSLQTKDMYFNDLQSGGFGLELAILCVAQEWGTIDTLSNPSPPNIAVLPNTYHYQGFFSGLPRYYGNCMDNTDGTFVCQYNINQTGSYVLRLALEEPGLNATYFNDTSFGHLQDMNFDVKRRRNQLLGLPNNNGSTVSWTGDIGGPGSVFGDRNFGSYVNKFKSRVEANIDFNWSDEAKGPAIWKNETLDAFENFNTITSIGQKNMKFREDYWSARWTGRITPNFAEEYIFFLNMDSNSNARLFIGGVGYDVNGSDDGTRRLVFSANSSNKARGVYYFSDTSPRDFTFEYIHRTGPTYVNISWQSPSNPLEVIPTSAFSHWRNITHRNLTIHPNTLCPSCSTVQVLLFVLKF